MHLLALPLSILLSAICPAAPTLRLQTPLKAASSPIPISAALSAAGASAFTSAASASLPAPTITAVDLLSPTHQAAESPQTREEQSAEAAMLFDGAGRLAPTASAVLGEIIDQAVREGRLDPRTGREIRRAGYVDHLTGALNRLYLEEKGASILPGHRTLIAFKLDWLKEINDAYGHAVGDRYLVETARIVRRLISGDGILIRRSPTGFAILTPLAAEPARLLAECLRAAIASRLAGRASPVYDAATHAPVRSTIQLGMASLDSGFDEALLRDRKSTRLNSSHNPASRMPSSA
jgi:diguanylate cyclase (GGDEF)-like protein